MTHVGMVSRGVTVSLVVVLLGVSVSACASDDAVESTATSVASTTVDTGTPSGETAVQWSAPLVGGGMFALASAPLERPVALWFWAPG